MFVITPPSEGKFSSVALPEFTTLSSVATIEAGRTDPWRALAGPDGPAASMVAYAADPATGDLLLFLSGLAAHTRLLAETGSLLLPLIRRGGAVEVMGDSAISLPPLNHRLSRDLIQRTKAAKLLGEFRQMPAADMDGLPGLVKIPIRKYFEFARFATFCL